MNATAHDERLPVGVLLPTRNAMPWLEKHLEGLKPWLHRAAEVVVVDSYSSDGTVDYLIRHLSHPSLKIVQHPPGLYASWNFGIQQIESPWLYISTVGDHIAPTGVEALVAACQEYQLDVAISAPVFLKPSGKKVDKSWPVHRYLRRAGRGAGRHVIPAAEVFIWNALFVPGSLIGSSASNLYRTSFMKEHPFRTDIGHAGDLAWGIENAFSARWGVVPECYSEFLLHPPVSRKPKSVTTAVKEELFALSNRILQQERAAGNPALVHYGEQLVRYWRASRKSMLFKDRHSGLGGGNKAFSLRPDVWRYRLRQTLYAVTRAYYRDKLLGQLYP